MQIHLVSGLGQNELLFLGQLRYSLPWLDRWKSVGHRVGWPGSWVEEVDGVDFPLEVLQLRIELEGNAILLLPALLHCAIGFCAFAECLDREGWAPLLLRLLRSASEEDSLVLRGGMCVKKCEPSWMVHDDAIPVNGQQRSNERLGARPYQSAIGASSSSDSKM